MVKEFLKKIDGMNDDQIIDYIINNDLEITKVGETLTPLPEEFLKIIIVEDPDYV